MTLVYTPDCVLPTIDTKPDERCESGGTTMPRITLAKNGVAKCPGVELRALVLKF
jgi:hypothetical protein